MDKNCSTLKESLVAIFATAVEMTPIPTGCIVTLPMKTVDDRYIDVYVEPVPDSDFVYVHDGGKSTAELFTQGIHPTDGQETLLKGVASRYGANFQNGRFQIACPSDAAVHQAVFAIGQCAALAMVEVVTHAPKIEDEPLSARVARALFEWKPAYVDIERRLHVQGKTGGDHLFDFVSWGRRATAQTVAVKLLPPSVGPSWQVSRYGYMVLDIEGQTASQWPRLAVISKADEWPTRAIAQVRSLSRAVIELETDKEERLDLLLPRMMSELTDAATA